MKIKNFKGEKLKLYLPRAKYTINHHFEQLLDEVTLGMSTNIDNKNTVVSI